MNCCAMCIRILVPLLLATGSAGVANAAETWNVDPVHSSLVFKIKHKDVANFYGSFGNLSGTIIGDDDNPENSSVRIAIDVPSVATRNPKRDEHLRSSDFFDVEQHPEIVYQSTSVTRVDEDTVHVEGELTMLGVTRPLVTDVDLTGRTEDLAGFETTFTIKRSDFGMDFMLGGGLGDEVEITLAVEAKRAVPDGAEPQ